MDTQTNVPKRGFCSSGSLRNLLHLTGDEVPLDCGWRSDQNGRGGSQPSAISAYPLTEMIRSGSKPPVPRRQVLSTIVDASLQNHFSPMR
jgi:hypothetical protein